MIEEGKKRTVAAQPSARGGQGEVSETPASASAGPRMAGPLFSGGMPKLRPVGSRATSSTASMPQPPSLKPHPMNKPSPAVRAAPPPPPPQPTTGMPSVVLRKVGEPAAARKAEKSVAPPPVPVVVRRPPPMAPALKTTRQQEETEEIVKNLGGMSLSRSGADEYGSKSKSSATTGLQSINGRWKFAGDAEMPPPPKFEGIQKVYPSGRTTGLTVQPPKLPTNLSNSSHISPAPPPQITKQQAPLKIPAVQSKPKKAVSSVDLIEAKIQQLNGDLKNAVAREEFEMCIEYRGRIKVFINHYHLRR